MLVFLSSALLVASIVAQNSSNKNNASADEATRFTNYAALNNKGYKDKQEFTKR